MAFLEDIIDAFYTCIILHNMMVKERCDGTIENAADYDCVQEDAEEQNPVRHRVNNLAMQFVAHQEQDVQRRDLEVNYLKGLGINVLDSSLPLENERIRVLPQYMRLAQYRWNQLYDSTSHVSLTKAIAKHLKNNYDNYKRLSSNY